MRMTVEIGKEQGDVTMAAETRGGRTAYKSWETTGPLEAMQRWQCIWTQLERARVI